MTFCLIFNPYEDKGNMKGGQNDLIYQCVSELFSDLLKTTKLDNDSAGICLVYVVKCSF